MIAIEHSGKIIPLGMCTARNTVGDVIEAAAFAVNSCEGVRCCAWGQEEKQAEEEEESAQSRRSCR